ncbi:MAG: hypothetical protein ACXVBJ_07320, partial [Flavisolibacter sp.]
KDDIMMVIVGLDYPPAKVRPPFGHPLTNLRLKGATNPKLAGKELQKTVPKRSPRNIESKADNSNDFDQNATENLITGLKPT